MDWGGVMGLDGWMGESGLGMEREKGIFFFKKR